MDGKDKMDESTKDEIRRLKRQKEMAEQDYKRDENFTLEQLKAISKFALQCVLELVIPLNRTNIFVFICRSQA